MNVPEVQGRAAPRACLETQAQCYISLPAATLSASGESRAHLQGGTLVLSQVVKAAGLEGGPERKGAPAGGLVLPESTGRQRLGGDAARRRAMAQPGLSTLTCRWRRGSTQPGPEGLRGPSRGPGCCVWIRKELRLSEVMGEAVAGPTGSSPYKRRPQGSHSLLAPMRTPRGKVATEIHRGSSPRAKPAWASI